MLLNQLGNFFWNHDLVNIRTRISLSEVTSWIVSYKVAENLSMLAASFQGESISASDGPPVRAVPQH